MNFGAGSTSGFGPALAIESGAGSALGSLVFGACSDKEATNFGTGSASGCGAGLASGFVAGLTLDYGAASAT